MFDRSRLDELDPAAALGAARAEQAAAQRSEANLLLVAAHVADLHPVPAGGEAAGWGDPALVGERLGPLAGAGTPEVAEFAPVELATALGVSADAGRQLIADALELRHRLPRLWARVLAGELAAWRARLVAEQTPELCPAAAGFVDRHLAGSTRALNRGRVREVVHEALLRHDPDAAAAREQQALDRRGVEVDHRESTATSRIDIRADTPDAIAFEDTIADLAAVLGHLGDTEPVDVRRARAVGALADPQASLDLLAGGHHRPDGTTTGTPPGQAGDDATQDTQPTSARRAPTRRAAAVLYLHIGLADLATHTTGSHGRGRVERLGPASLDLLRDWAGRTDLTIKPVLDMNRPDTVEGHDPPGWMRETVTLRDGHCVFPYCERDARACDLDHTTGYDDHGPPGQTSVEALACLCRRHHRAKTFHRWRYHRLPDGDYEWTSPHGAGFHVTPHGGTTRT